MQKILLGITLILCFNGIRSFGQSTFTKQEWEIISRNILDEHSDNARLRAEAKADSVQIAALTLAYTFKNEALQEALKAYAEANRIGQDWHKMYTVSEVQAIAYKKAYRKQKFLKWVAVVGIGLVAVGAAVN